MAIGWQKPRCLICRHLEWRSDKSCSARACIPLLDQSAFVGCAHEAAKVHFPEVGESGASSPAAATLLASSFSCFLAPGTAN